MKNNKDLELDIDKETSLEEAISLKKNQLKHQEPQNSSKKVHKFYLSSKDDKFKLTDSKNKSTTFYDSFYDAISAFVKIGEVNLQNNINSRIWLYQNGSFRATLTWVNVKKWLDNDLINANDIELKETLLEQYNNNEISCTDYTQETKHSQVVLSKEKSLLKHLLWANFFIWSLALLTLLIALLIYYVI